MNGSSGEIARVVRAEADDAGARLDAVLARRLPHLSRTRIKALVEAGHVAIGGRTVGEPSRRINSGETITLVEPPPVPARPAAEAIPLTVLHEDRDIVVLDKPAGLVVHPGAGNPSGTLVNALLAHCRGSLSGIGGVERPGIVHRLDKDTSGVMVAAKTDAAHASLSAQFADHGRTGFLERVYAALAWGAPGRPRLVIDAPIGRVPENRERMGVTARGRPAVTRVEIVEAWAAAAGEGTVASLLDCRLETGRTHQIRVHLAHIGCPVLGDPDYGAGFRTKANLLPETLRPSAAAFPRQALHARKLAFAHPRDGRRLVFETEPPTDMRDLLAAFRVHLPTAGGALARS